MGQAGHAPGTARRRLTRGVKLCGRLGGGEGVSPVRGPACAKALLGEPAGQSSLERRGEETTRRLWPPVSGAFREPLRS